MYFLQRIKKKLIIGFSKRAGKNSFGRKTIFTQSGGLRLKLFSVDFKRNQNCNAILFSIEKKNQYTSFLGLVFFSNGIICYILLSNFMLTIGQQILGLSLITKKNSISSYLKNIPSGNFINHIETKVNSKKGAVIMRAAGTTCFIISKDKNYSYLKLSSGWFLKISNFCLATLGSISNQNHHLNRIEKAGNKRKMGFRPTVRGIAKNPCDHPHGGGEGRGSPPKAHKTPYGKLTKSPTKIKKKFLLKKKRFKIFK